MSDSYQDPAVLWTRTNINTLIEAYKERPCLYDFQSKDYYNRDLKRQAEADIAELLNTTVDDVTRKWKNIRTQYVREKGKIRTAKKNGTLKEGTLICKWTHFPYLGFLDDFITSKPSGKREADHNYSSDEGHDEHEEEDEVGIEQLEDACNTPDVNNHLDEYSANHSASLQRRINAIKRPRSDQEEDYSTPTPLSMLNMPLCQPENTLPTPEDPEDLFGKYIASELKDIKNRQARRHAKLRIQTVLYEAQSGQTTPASTYSPLQPSIHIHAPTYPPMHSSSLEYGAHNISNFQSIPQVHSTQRDYNPGSSYSQSNQQQNNLHVNNVSSFPSNPPVVIEPEN